MSSMKRYFKIGSNQGLGNRYSQFSCSMLGLKETNDQVTATLKDCKVTNTAISTTATTTFFCFLLAKAVLNSNFFANALFAVLCNEV